MLVLDELSLLDTNQSKTVVALWPFLIRYIDESVDKEDKSDQMMILCDHYGQLLHRLFMVYQNSVPGELQETISHFNEESKVSNLESSN